MKRFVGVAAVVVLTGGLITAGAMPANAANCDNAIWSEASAITIYPILPTPCALVQAKMYRYYGSTIVTLLGPQSSNVSQVASTNGYNSGNYVRVKATSTWAAWIHVPY